MKNKSILIGVMPLLFLAAFACGPFAGPAPTLTINLSTEEPAASGPTATQTLLSPPSVVATAGSEPTVQVPAAEPQPAISGHYHAGAPVQLDDIYMMSLTEGWGISGQYVLVTSDGGQTWREVTPPEMLPADTPAKAYGAFLDQETAWVVFSSGDQIVPEASVWHTTDGGQTWASSVPLLHQVIGDSVWAEFATLDAENTWLMVRGVQVGAGIHPQHELFRTMDGGLTWISLDGEVSDDYTGMVFVDASTGWRTWQTTGAYAPAPPEYGVTTDSGAHWDSRNLPPPPDAPDLFDQYPYCESFQPNLLSIQSVRLLVGCFDSHYPPESFTSYLYASDDGGSTWGISQLPDTVLASQDRLIFFDADSALLLGRNMYRSTDGGRTWSHVSTVNWDGRFSFVDPQHGWAVARANNEVALVTTADGANWVQIEPIIMR